MRNILAHLPVRGKSAFAEKLKQICLMPYLISPNPMPALLWILMKKNIRRQSRSWSPASRILSSFITSRRLITAGFLQRICLRVVNRTKLHQTGNHPIPLGEPYESRLILGRRPKPLPRRKVGDFYKITLS